jgi:hypothetical protein
MLDRRKACRVPVLPWDLLGAFLHDRCRARRALLACLHPLLILYLGDVPELFDWIVVSCHDVGRHLGCERG